MLIISNETSMRRAFAYSDVMRKSENMSYSDRAAKINH